MFYSLRWQEIAPSSMVLRPMGYFCRLRISSLDWGLWTHPGQPKIGADPSGYPLCPRRVFFLGLSLLLSACRRRSSRNLPNRTRSGGFLQQISLIGARRTLLDAALQWTLAVAAAGRVVGCAGRAEFASPAHILGAAAVVAATDGRLGARLVLHGGRPIRPPATASHLQPQTRGRDTCGLI